MNATGDADNLLEIDFQGPVPIEAVPQTDYYLILSGLVILFSIGYAVKQYQDSITAAYHRLTNLFHYDHPHLDWGISAASFSSNHFYVWPEYGLYCFCFFSGVTVTCKLYIVNMALDKLK